MRKLLDILFVVFVGLFGLTVGMFGTMHMVKKRLAEQGYEAYWAVVCKDVNNIPFFFEDLHVTFIDQDGKNLTIDGYDDNGKEYKIHAEGWCVLSKPRSMQ